MSQLKQLLERIEWANRRDPFLRRQDSIVVGVSGGPDSAALLFLLSKMRRKFSLKLSAAHLNHGLNVREAARYEIAARNLAEKLDIPFFLRRVNVRARARKLGRSLEETGRLERYRFFAEVAKRARSSKIATAHTLDDQAETVLMRVIRGAGLKGLAGIPLRRPEGNLTVIRPLLSCRKKHLIKLLREEKIQYCADKSNRSSLFTRNRVRHDLLKRLERRYNPSIHESLAALQRVCREAQDYLESSARRFMKSHARFRGGRVVLGPAFMRLHPALQRQCVIEAFFRLKGHVRGIAQAHILSVLDLAAGPPSGRCEQLPGGLRVDKNASGLRFRR